MIYYVALCKTSTYQPLSSKEAGGCFQRRKLRRTESLGVGYRDSPLCILPTSSSIVSPM